jgi:plasmid maintenance system antidote protein VapI
MTTGLDLKLQRVGSRVKANLLAEQMGVSSARVSAIENQAVVTDETATKYLAALQTLTTIPTQAETPSAA